MKVVLVSTSDRKGGAAIACTRIFNALRKNGAEVKMLVRDKLSDDPDVHSLNTNIFWKFRNFMSMAIERLMILLKLRLDKEYLWQVSLDNMGAGNLLQNPLIREADVINFHWTSQGMLSLSQLQQLLEAGKHMVFTMHDMHYFTGICHYSRTCQNFQTGCGNCVFLKGAAGSNDLSRRWFSKKMAIENRQNLIFVACSNWLRDIAKTSGMFTDNRVLSVPNPINTDVFHETDRDTARQKYHLSKKHVILFGAANISDKRKGFDYLVQALQHINRTHPELNDKIELLVFGQGDKNKLAELPYDYQMAGYVSSEQDLATLYTAADVFVTPSLEDNLPNTVMESLSCSTPCVAFDAGGLSQLIDSGYNGYLAQYRNHEDLGNCILKVLLSRDYTQLCQNARTKVESNFSETVIAMKYSELYRQALI